MRRLNTCVTMQSAEDKFYNSHGMTKVPLENQMNTVPKVLVLLSPSESEAPKELLFPIDKAM